MSEAARKRFSGRALPLKDLVLGGFLIVCCGALAFVVFRHLSYPLLWEDEAETAMFGERVLIYGYPKVSDAENSINSLDLEDPSWGVRRPFDAYIVSGWAQYYVGAVGTALASLVSDLYAKTFLIRFPFAALGVTGLLLMGWAIVRQAPQRDRWWLLSLMVALSLLCVPLLLHIREARYYPLMIFSTAWFVLFYLGALSGGTRTLSVPRFTFLAFGMFLVYPPAAIPLVFTFGGYWAWHALRPFLDLRTEGNDQRYHVAVLPGARSAFVSALYPVVVAGLVLIPFFLFFRTFTLNALLREYTGNHLQVVANLRIIITFLVSWGVLPAYFLLKIGNVFLKRHASLAPSTPLGEASHVLALLAAAFTVTVIFTPWFLFERYFIVLYPIMAAAVVAEVAQVAILLRVLPSVRLHVSTHRHTMVRPRTVGTALVFVVLIGSLFPVFFWGNVVTVWKNYAAELRVPVVGPVDVAIDTIIKQVPDPARLLIATNYEEYAYMYYLGGRVIVGFVGARLGEDATESPDVVIVRNGWLRPERDVVENFLRQYLYRKIPLAAADTLFNTIPESSMHPYRTVTSPPHAQLILYMR